MRSSFAVTDAVDLALTLAVPVSTRLSRWTGAGKSEVDRAREFEGVVSPPPAAFVIWAPIFAGLTCHALLKVVRPPAVPADSAAALLRVSLLGNLLWNLNAQFKDFGWQSVALIGASAATATAAVAGYERVGATDPTARNSARLIGPLAGWLSVATFANVETAQRYTRSPSESWLTPTALAGMAALTAAGGVVATRANAGYALAAVFGLGGIAVKNLHTRPRLGFTAVAGLVALSVLVLAIRRRPA
jgi:hypothetical protein